MTNEEKTIAGFRYAYVYENGRTGSISPETSQFLTRKRLRLKESFYDGEGTDNLRRLILTMKLDKKCPVVFNYAPADEREYDYLYFAMLYRGFSEIYFVNEHEVSELTKYITQRAKDDLTSKILVGRKERIERGESLFTRCPYGYEYHRGKLRVNEYEAFIVKYVFYRKMQGAGNKQIAGELSARGFHNRKGGLIYVRNVEHILEHKKIYQGYISYLGKMYYGNHTHLIDDDCCPIGKFGERLDKADLKLSRETRKKLDKFKLEGKYNR